MPENENERNSHWKTAAICVPLLLVLYALSIGPAVWITANVPLQYSTTAIKTIEYVYAPLGWLIEQSETINDLYFQYVSLWVDLSP